VNGDHPDRQLTEPLAEAIAEAERLIASAPFISSQQDLVEGYEYLAGSIRASLQMAAAYDRRFPYFLRSTHQFTKMGLDNPDTLYFHANITDDATYRVTGRRGSTADLSFQVMNGDYSPASSPDSLTAFDDRDLDVAPDGTFELFFGPRSAEHADRIVLGEGSAMLIVREVFSDWATEEPGEIRIERVDTVGEAPAPPDLDRMRKVYAVAGKMLLGRIKTWFAFPEWFYLKEPVNTLTEPRRTPGGLSSQFSSVGHFDLTEDQVMVITVPDAGMAYQGLQLGSMWYVSLDYVNHQTSLTSAQAKVDPDRKIRFVVSEQNPGVVNWLETLGHTRGYVQLRWQHVTRDLTPDDGPSVEVVKLDELPDRLPYYDESRMTQDEYELRIAARQRHVASRMLG
jgi:hypothetical protein